MDTKIGKDALILTISKIVIMFISLISSMLLSRFRTLEEYGTYSQLLIIINLATALFTLGLPSSVNYFLGRTDSHEERGNFLSVYYTLNTLLCFLMGVVLVVATPVFVKYFDNEHIYSFIYILGILPWTMIIISSISNVLVVYSKTKKLMLFNIINSSITIFVIVIVKVFGLSFKQYMFFYLCGECIMMIWAYFIVLNLENHITIKINTHMIKNIFVFSLPIGFSSLVGTLTLECDKLVIGTIFNTETLAIYSNAAKELPFTLIASSLTAVLLPQVARKLKENKTIEAIELWKITVELSYIFMSFFVSVLIVFAPQIMSILYSDKYLTGVNIFRIYSAVLLLRITYFGMILNALGKTKYILLSSIITLAVNVILDIVLYEIIGLLGPAVATFISILSSVVTQLLITSRQIKTKLKNLFPWKKIVLHSLVNIMWSLPTFFIINLLGVGVTNKEIILCIVSGILIMIIYILIERKRVFKLWSMLNRNS